MTLQRKFLAWCIAMALACASGVLITWAVMAARQAVIETAAPAQTQADGSVVIERAPDPAAKPAHRIPKGAKLERTVHVEAQGQGIRLPSLPGGEPGKLLPCPPVAIDLSLVRERDGGRRVVASSPDGEILNAVDVPVESAAPPPAPRPWAAGVSYNPQMQTPGVWIERDLGRVRLGAEVNQTRLHVAGPTGIEGRVRVGWVW